MVRSKTDVEAEDAVMAITLVAMQALDDIRPMAVGSEVKVFGLSESQIARRVRSSPKLQAFPIGSSSAATAAGSAWPAAWPRTAPHPRYRTPGPLEAGRRHGRPLHPRRNRRVGAAVSVMDKSTPACRVSAASRECAAAEITVRTSLVRMGVTSRSLCFKSCCGVSGDGVAVLLGMVAGFGC